MPLSEALRVALNDQLGNEFQASYNYLAMSSWFEAESWDGFASWMALQSAEERVHAMKFYQYLLDRGAGVSLPALEAPNGEFKTPLDVFEQSREQEQEVTASINRLYKVAIENDDYATVSFLKWFLDEQVEEEKAVGDMIEKLSRAGENPEAMMLLDREAGQRVADGEE